MITKSTRMCIVREHIQKGYGVEDIAVMFRLPLKEVRFDVSLLREEGALKYMFPVRAKKTEGKAI